MFIGEKPIQLLHVFVVLLLVCNKLALGLTSDAKIGCIEREKQALLKFKETLIDDSGVLSSWGSEELKKDCCKWRGVRCNNHTGHVTRLDLRASSLSLDGLYRSLGGGLPDCWEHFEELRVMNLANNNLTGKLPLSMGSLYQINALQLRNNNFSEELPMSLTKCVGLRIVDLGGNKFTGKIQAWIGTQLTSLIVLILKSNKFHGSIPQHICHLNDIQVLDFSQNDLSGKPPQCFNNFSALVQRSSLEDTIDFGYVSGTFVDLYEAYALVQWKGQEREYRKKLGLLKVIDLSSNKFSGKIPEQVASLAELVSLNLSRNNFSGKITEEIGGMKMLESLDLSANRLSGKIPLSPQLQSFDASTYSGNPQLCGLPLKKCSGEEIVADPPVTPHGKDKRIQEEEEDKFITPGFYISMGLGFAVGFGVVFGQHTKLVLCDNKTEYG